MIRNAIYAVSLLLLAWAVFAIHGCHKDVVAEAAREANARASAWKEAANLWEDRALDAGDALAECTDLWTQARANAEELARLKDEAEAQHRAQIQVWQNRWSGRPQACSDLLVAMEHACEPSLGRIE